LHFNSEAEPYKHIISKK